MTAICKTILIHGQNLQGILDYGSDQEKTSISKNDLADAISYAANPLKTLADLDDGDKELLVSGVLCQPQTAVEDFGLVRAMYHTGTKENYAAFEYLDKRTGKSRYVKKEPVTAIHLIQSFAETDLDPRTVHQIGIDLCERLGVQAVVDTHVNKDHLHNHIIINAYMPDGKSKFCMDAEMRMRIRELSDEIQLSYGIELKMADPRSQLYRSKGKHSYREWDAIRQNISWKEEMKSEIAAARSVSDSREDFITIMQDYGYEIARQEANSITWWNKTHTRKIRDKTLGDAYELGALFPANSPAPDYVVGREPAKEHHHPKTISIARYDWNGRRRSDLEMLIRKAIALIQHIKNRYQPKNISSSHSTSKKLEIMEHALTTVQKMGFENKEDLAKQMDSVGARLNHVKSELSKMEGQKTYYDTVAPMLISLQATLHMVNSVKYWPDGKMPDLMLESYTDAEIRRAKALLSPMNNAQKRDLFLALQSHPEYALPGNGFSEISSTEAEEIFAFFKGMRQGKPECLWKSVDVTMERIYQVRNNYLKETFNKPIQNYQIRETAALLEAHGISLDVSTLTQYDVISIRNCYGPNPFSETPIGEGMQQQFSHRLSERGLSLNRDIKYILPSEYQKLMRYLDGISQTMPGLLKPSPLIDPESARTLQEFMNAKGITSTVPSTAMSKADYDKMYGYVLAQGHAPECVLPKTENLSEKFIDSIQIDGITDKKKLLLLHLRNQVNELAELGIDPFHPETLETDMAKFQADYAALETQRTELAKEYRSLAQLSQAIIYAESPNFLFGSLFNEKVHEATEIVETDERAKKENPKTAEHSKKKIDMDMDPDL